MELTSKISQLIELTNYDLDEQKTLDDLANKVTYLSEQLEYDSDYDIEVYFQNMIGNSEEENDREDNDIYNKLKRFGIKMLKRYGISISEEIKAHEFHNLVNGIVEVFNFDIDTVNEILEFKNGYDYNNSKDLFIAIMDDFTCVETYILESYVISSSERLFLYLEKSEDNPDEEFDMSIINKLEVIDSELLGASILKPIMKLGKMRLPDVINYIPMLKSVNNGSVDMISKNVAIIFMHVDKACEISYSVYDKNKPIHYLERIKELDVESLVSDDISISVEVVGNYVKKVQGIKL